MIIAEEFLVLCFDDETGKKLVGTERIDPALGGAILAELALLERIDVAAESAGRSERGRVSLLSGEPTGDAELDRAVQFLSEHRGKKVKDLIGGMSRSGLTKGLRDRLLARLAAAGVLSEQKGTVLAVFPVTRWPTVDGVPEAAVRERLHGALVHGLTPSDRTVTLVGLLEATDVLTKVVPTDDKRALKARAKTLSQGDWAARAVKDAINEVSGSTGSVAIGDGGGDGGGGGD